METFYVFNFTMDFLEAQAQGGFRVELSLHSMYASSYLHEIKNNPFNYDA